MLYFDHNATTPVCRAAREAWLEACENLVGNASSQHRLGGRAEAALDSARAKLAAVLGCDAAQILWTSGATESNNMVLHHSARTCSPGQGVLISAIEHPCVLRATEFYFPKHHDRIPVSRSGVADVQWLSERLRSSRPALVALMAANNETGVLLPWRAALEMCREKNVPFFCDAAQWIGKLPARELGQCDFVSGCAHKFGGPKGIGFLKCPENTQPLLLGGPQQGGRRAGTEDVPGVLAMIAALEDRERRLIAGEAKARLAWRKKFEKQLLEALSGSQIVGGAEERLWNTVSAIMPEIDCRQRWVVRVDKFGCAASTGSACSSGREKPSHVLAAMDFTAAEASRVLRFSSGWETTEADWDMLLATLVKTHKSFLEAEK